MDIEKITVTCGSYDGWIALALLPGLLDSPWE